MPARCRRCRAISTWLGGECRHCGADEKWYRIEARKKKPPPPPPPHLYTEDELRAYGITVVDEQSVEQYKAMLLFMTRVVLHLTRDPEFDEVSA